MNNKPIKVAQIMGKLWAGGVEMVVFNYYREIDKSKIQFDFYYDSDSTVEPPQELIDMGARFIKIPPYQRLPEYLKTLNRYFKENEYTIVHSHINTLSVFPLYVAWKSKIPVRIAHNHSVPGGKEYKKNLLKYFFRMFSRVFATDYFACSEKAGRWMWGQKSLKKGDVLVLYNALNKSRFLDKKNDVSQLQEKFGIKNKIVIGHVGRFTYAKNHKYLIDLFEQISKKIPEAVLMLVGDGELHDEIISMLKEKNIYDKAILVGNVSNPEMYYAIMDMTIFPSLYEGLALAVVESQIAGVPVVASYAVPKEAVISNAVQRLSLKCSLDKWVKAVSDSLGKKVELSENSELYDVTKQAPKLCKWYLKKYEKNFSA